MTATQIDIVGFASMCSNGRWFAAFCIAITRRNTATGTSFAKHVTQQIGTSCLDQAGEGFVLTA